MTSEADSTERPTVDIAGIGAWSKADFERKREVVEQLRLRLRGIGVPREHIFWGVRIGTPLLPKSAGSSDKLSVRLLTAYTA